MRRLQKTMLFFGAVAITLLLISSTTAVQCVQSETTTNMLSNSHKKDCNQDELIRDLTDWARSFVKTPAFSRMKDALHQLAAKTKRMPTDIREHIKDIITDFSEQKSKFNDEGFSEHLQSFLHAVQTIPTSDDPEPNLLGPLGIIAWVLLHIGAGGLFLLGGLLANIGFSEVSMECFIVGAAFVYLGWLALLVY